MILTPPKFPPSTQPSHPNTNALLNPSKVSTEYTAISPKHQRLAHPYLPLDEGHLPSLLANGTLQNVTLIFHTNVLLVVLLSIYLSI